MKPSQIYRQASKAYRQAHNSRAAHLCICFAQIATRDDGVNACRELAQAQRELRGMIRLSEVRYV